MTQDDDLPTWAAEMTPLNMDQAALVLGISRRTLTDLLKAHPHYELRGRVEKVFYAEHIAKLRRVEWGSQPDSVKAASIRLAAPAQEGALESALRRTMPKRRKR